MRKIVLTAALVLAACGGSEQAPTPGPATTAAAPTASSGGIGIAACDDYLTRYEACLGSKVPDSARPALQQSLESTRASWIQAAASPAGRDGLQAACEQVHAASRPSLHAYGCSDF